MKTVHNLMRFDTDKADEMATLEDGIVLYKTEKGNWFTYQETCNSFVSLTETEAALMLEKLGKWDLLEELFGHLIKDA
jgi:hypothetical protein